MENINGKIMNTLSSKGFGYVIYTSGDVIDDMFKLWHDDFVAQDIRLTIAMTIEDNWGWTGCVDGF